MINADDYCLSDAINKAVVKLAKHGLINSVSVLINNPSVNYQYEIGKLNNVKIGLHLNLSEGKPLCKQKLVSSLVNSKGEFYSLPFFWLRYMFGLIKKEHISLEIDAQYAKLASVNITRSCRFS